MSWDREEKNALKYVFNSLLVLLWKSQNRYRCHSNFPPVVYFIFSAPQGYTHSQCVSVPLCWLRWRYASRHRVGPGTSTFHRARILCGSWGFGLMLLASFSEEETVHIASGRYWKAVRPPWAMEDRWQCPTSRWYSRDHFHGTICTMPGLCRQQKWTFAPSTYTK